MALPTASDNVWPKLIMAEQGSAPAAPSAGQRTMYVDSGFVLRWKDDASLVSPIAALNKWDAAGAPTVNDDSGDGYAVGSRWIDVTNDKEYICLDATAGAAVWKETTAGSGSFTGFSDHSETNTQVATTATNGAITTLHTRTLTGLVAGTYLIYGQLHQATAQPGTLRLRTSAPTTIQEQPTHTFTGLKSIMGRYVHGATGDLTLELAHVSEGASVTYGSGTDWRFGRRLDVWRVA